MGCNEYLGRTFVAPDKFQAHKDAVWIFLVRTERAAVAEAIALIQPVRRLECFHRAGLKAEPFVASATGHFDDVRQNQTPRPLPSFACRGAHGFDLAMNLVQFLERATPDKTGLAPDGPERDI